MKKRRWDRMKQVWKKWYAADELKEEKEKEEGEKMREMRRKRRIKVGKVLKERDEGARNLE